MTLRLVLHRIGGIAEHQSVARCVRRAGTSLLEDVRELMRQQALARHTLWRVLAGTEHDIATHGIGAGVDGICRFGGSGVYVHAHMAEVLAEPRLQIAARCASQRLASRGKHLVDDAWHRAG
jgi:hypothetical protein